MMAIRSFQKSAVIRSDTSENTVEAIDWEFALPGEGIPELRKVKASRVRLDRATQ